MAATFQWNLCVCCILLILCQVQPCWTRKLLVLKHSLSSIPLDTFSQFLSVHLFGDHNWYFALKVLHQVQTAPSKNYWWILGRNHQQYSLEAHAMYRYIINSNNLALAQVSIAINQLYLANRSTTAKMVIFLPPEATRVHANGMPLFTRKGQKLQESTFYSNCLFLFFSHEAANFFTSSFKPLPKNLLLIMW